MFLPGFLASCHIVATHLFARPRPPSLVVGSLVSAGGLTLGAEWVTREGEGGHQSLTPNFGHNITQG